MKTYTLKQLSITPAPLHLINASVVSLDKRTDHEVMILGGAYLDQALRSVIETKLILSVLESDDCLNSLFKNRGPLAAFGDRISIALSFGFIPDAIANDLKIVQKVRNLYAHTAHEINLDAPPISELCAKMTAYKTVTSDMHESAGEGAEWHEREIGTVVIDGADYPLNDSIVILAGDGKIVGHIPQPKADETSGRLIMIQSIQAIWLVLLQLGIKRYLKAAV